MKTYLEIGNVRTIDIKVILDDDKVLYEGLADNAPEEVKKMRWSKLEGSYPMRIYVYSNAEETTTEN